MRSTHILNPILVPHSEYLLTYQIFPYLVPHIATKREMLHKELFIFHNRHLFESLHMVFHRSCKCSCPSVTAHTYQKWFPAASIN
jgi:hypothetical protein